MAATDNITQERLKELLRYDPETGLFTWLKSRGPAKSGSIAGCHDKKDGYIRIKIDGVSRLAHRLAFLYVLGWMPDEVDHDDQVRHRNQWNNLNSATITLNNRNATLRKDSTSGVTGVHWLKRNKKWQAHIRVNKKPVHLGLFTHKPDAIAARQAADIKYGFHVNHGLLSLR